MSKMRGSSENDTEEQQTKFALCKYLNVSFPIIIIQETERRYPIYPIYIWIYSVTNLNGLIKTVLANWYVGAVLELLKHGTWAKWEKAFKMIQRTQQTKLAFCIDLWMSFRIIIVQSVPCIFLNADSARKGSQESESLTFPHWWCTKLKHVYQTTMRNWVLPKIGCIAPKLGKTGGNLGRGGPPQTDGSAPVSYYWCQYL